MPASWTPGGHTALFVVEAPEVLFLDFPAFHVSQSETYLPIDPRFLEVCEPGCQFKAICGCEEPIAVGGKVVDGQLRIRLAETPATPVEIAAMIVGVRKKAGGLRFPNRTLADFEANERFLSMARPK